MLESGAGMTRENYVSRVGCGLKPLRKTPMQIVRKQLVTDEQHRPVAVQINYDDWLRIEQQLKIQAPPVPAVDLSRYAGTVNLT